MILQWLFYKIKIVLFTFPIQFCSSFPKGCIFFSVWFNTPKGFEDIRIFHWCDACRCRGTLLFSSCYCQFVRIFGSQKVLAIAPSGAISSLPSDVSLCEASPIKKPKLSFLTSLMAQGRKMPAVLSAQHSLIWGRTARFSMLKACAQHLGS